MAGDEPVTSPDQHRPGHPRAARIGAFSVALILLTMTLGNHTVGGRGWGENAVLIALAAALLLALVVDWVLRRNGLRP